MEETAILNTDTEKLVINLSKPTDTVILDYLFPFERTLWEEKARDALKVGVVAIKSASPVLDAKIIEEKFKDAKREMDNLLKDFKNELNGNLKDYFHNEKGHVKTIFTDIFGPNGQLHQRLERQLGPESNFAKKLDPDNKESVIASVEKTVEELLVGKLEGLTDEFSLDKEGSAISRLQKVLTEKIGEIKQAVVKQETKKEEAEVGTQKGRDFQEIIYLVSQNLCKKYGDVPHYCADTPGSIPRCKTGDIVCEISNTDGNKVVFEAKKERGYALRKALEELKEAKENRGAQVGVFVFAKGYEPEEVGSFQIHEHDIVCTYDEEEQDIESSMLRAAYIIARTNVLQSKRVTEVGVDLNSIAGHIKSLMLEIEKFNGVKSGLEGAMRAIKGVDQAIESLRTEIKKYLDCIDFELKKVSANPV